MRRFRWIVPLQLIAVLSIGCDHSAPSRREITPPTVTGVVLRVREGRDLTATIATINKSQPALQLSVQERSLLDPNSAWIVAEGSVSPDDVLKRLSAHPDVELVSPNKELSIRLSTDPLSPELWGLKNYGQEAPAGLPGRRGADLKIETAWAETEGSRSVVVAVLDTGVDYTHPDIAVVEDQAGKPVPNPEKSNLWVNAGEIPGDRIDNDGNGLVDDYYGWNFVTNSPDPMDDHGHGTHCAGTIAAQKGNLIGIVGVAPKVRILAIKWLNGDGSGSTWQVYQAILYVNSLARRYKDTRFIMSNSWGMSGREVENDRHNPLIYAIRQSAELEIPFVVAAGNSALTVDENYETPVSFGLPNQIAVAATNNLDELASFSNYGHQSVHVAAPGVNILSTVPKKLYGTEYASFSGTSMATPHVAGVVALLLSKYPTLTAAAVRDRLIKSSDRVEALVGRVVAGGRINAGRALTTDIYLDPIVSFEKRPYSFRSIRNYSEGFDQLYRLEVPGAEAFKIHFPSIEVNGGDYVQILNKDFDVIVEYTGVRYDLWTPPILGDTAYVRLWVFSGLEIEGLSSAPQTVLINQGYEIDQLAVAAGPVGGVR